MKKVRVNSIYLYHPVLIDKCDSRIKIKEGTQVRVINLPNAPKANTMGHCYVEDLKGNFLGLVCCNSLQSRKDVKKS